MKNVLNLVRDHLAKSTFRKHFTTMGWREAPKYTRYLRHCQKMSAVKMDGIYRQLVDDFESNGIVSVENDITREVGRQIAAQIDASLARGSSWQPNTRENFIAYKGNVLTDFPELRSLFELVVGPVMRQIYGAHYKLFYAVMMRSVNGEDAEVGSQLWHTDGGPGTCVNVMFLPAGATKKQGAMQALGWAATEKLLIGCREHIRSEQLKSEAALSKTALREKKAEWYEQAIKEGFADSVIQLTGEAGMLLFFRNNCIHKGGFPDLGETRDAIIFHFYPADVEADLDSWFSEGKPKKGPYPTDPAFN